MPMDSRLQLLATKFVHQIGEAAKQYKTVCDVLVIAIDNLKDAIEDKELLENASPDKDERLFIKECLEELVYLGVTVLDIIKADVDSYKHFMRSLGQKLKLWQQPSEEELLAKQREFEAKDSHLGSMLDEYWLMYSEMIEKVGFFELSEKIKSIASSRDYEMQELVNELVGQTEEIREELTLNVDFITKLIMKIDEEIEDERMFKSHYPDENQRKIMKEYLRELALMVEMVKRASIKIIVEQIKIKTFISTSDLPMENLLETELSLQKAKDANIRIRARTRQAYEDTIKKFPFLKFDNQMIPFS